PATCRSRTREIEERIARVYLSRLGAVNQEIPVAVEGQKTYDLRSLTDDIDGAFLSSGGIGRVRDALRSGQLPELAEAANLRSGAAIAIPTKIVCIGLNYRDHAEETKAEIPSEPVVFMKDPSTITGPNDEVFIPRK